MTEGLRIRSKDDDKLHPDGFAAQLAFGELFIDDATGFVSGSDATAEKIDATPVKVGSLNNVSADAAERAATTSGQLTITRPGHYLVYASGSVALAGAADTFACEVFRDGSVCADAAATPGGEISAQVIAVGTGVQGWALQGILPDCAKGTTVDLRVTTTGTTTATIKQMRFMVLQISDDSNASQS